MDQRALLETAENFERLGLGIEAHHLVRQLQGDPQRTVAIEMQGMRAAALDRDDVDLLRGAVRVDAD